MPNPDPSEESLKSLSEIQQRIIKQQSEMYEKQRDIYLLEKDAVRAMQVGSTDREQQARQQISLEKALLSSMQAKLDLEKSSLDLTKKSTGLISDASRSVRGLTGLWKNFNLVQFLGWNKTYYLSQLVAESIGEIGAKSAVLLGIGKEIGKQFQNWDSGATAFRHILGAFRPEMEAVKFDVYDTALSMAKLGVSMGDILGTTLELGAKMGGVHNVSLDLLKTLTAFSVSLGVSADTSSEILKILGASSGTLMESNTNALLFGKRLSFAAGVPLSTVMGDVASLSGDALAIVSKLPEQMIKAAVEARRLNSSIGELATGAASMLDFTASVNKEMEASVLIGKNISLQGLRQAAYAGDMLGYMEGIKKVLSETKFEKLDFFQKRAVADALGQSLESLMSMAQAQREIDNALKSSNPRVKAMADEYQRLLSLNKTNADVEGQSVERSLMSLNNQQHMVAISQSWHKILSDVGRIFLPIIDKVLGFVADHFDEILTVTLSLVTAWKTIRFNVVKFGEDMGKLGGSLGKIYTSTIQFASKLLSPFKGIAEWISAKFVGSLEIFSKLGSKIGILGRGIGEFFGGLFTRFGGLLKAAGRFVIPLTFAYHIFENIRDLLNDPALMGTQGFFSFNGKLLLRALQVIVKSLWETFDDLLFGLPSTIIKGLVSVSDSIGAALVSGFKSAWEWIKNIFVGSSPSMIGLGIVQGLVGVGDMVFDALVSPFKSFLNWLSGLPILKNIDFGKVGAPTIQGQAQSPNYASVQMTAEPPATVGTPATAVSVQASPNASRENDLATEKTCSEMVTLLKAILAKDTNLYVDGQRLSAELARQTLFKGGYGVNRVQIS